jgi:hypothetical protein
MGPLRWIIAIAVMLLTTFVTKPAAAVAFKLKNDSSITVRARVHDRGQWRPWVTFQPGGWAVFAPKVKRTEHDVEIDVWEGGRWQPIYRNHHGSRFFTRVVQVVQYSGDDKVYFAWWDEPPGCRDAPPRPGTNDKTCLKPSGGWLWKKLVQSAVKIVGRFYTVGW